MLLIDEVKTGFRVARGGVQELYGVRRRPVHVRQGGRPTAIRSRCSPGARTSCASSAAASRTAAPTPRTRSSLAAAEKTLEILDETDALERIADYGTRLRNGMRAVLSARGIPHSFVGHPSMSGLYFAQEPPRNYRDWKGSDYSFYDAMAKVLHDELILCEPDSREPWFVSRRARRLVPDGHAERHSRSRSTHADALRHDAPVPA